MNGSRRLSQALSEGDGISLLAPVADASQASAAEGDGAEAIVTTGPVAGLRDATALPILWRGAAPPRAALDAGADACVLVVEDGGNDGERLGSLYAEAQNLGIEAVVRVRDDEELAFALEHVDPEILLLSGLAPAGGYPLDGVLELLPDIPAGKLAIAEVPVESREEILALERAGVDGAIVDARDVARLVGGPPPEV